MKYNVNRAVVLGAGAMGSGIAALMAGAGIQVKLLDIVPPSLSEGEEAKGLTLRDRAVRNRFADNGKKKLYKTGEMYSIDLDDLISTGNFEDDLESVRQADLVIEAVIEEMDVKKELFGRVADYVTSDCLIATNTSGLSVNQIAQGLPESLRGRFIGVHFFNPPRYMNLVEIIPTADTLPEVVAFIEEFASRRLGKTTVVALDTPGFITNRAGNISSLINLNLTKKYNFSFAQTDALQGPLIGRSNMAVFGVQDLSGIDLYAVVTEAVRKTCANDAIRPYLELPDYYLEMIANNQLGNKTGKGFYQRIKSPQRATLMWDREHKEYIPKPEAAIPALAAVDPGASTGEKVWAILSSDTVEGEYLWEYFTTYFSYLAEITPEITDDFRKIDIALKNGYGWKLGPFELWDELGAQAIVEQMPAHGREVPDWVRRHLDAHQGRFYDAQGFGALVARPRVSLADPGLACVWQNDDVALKDIGDGIGCIEIRSKNSVLTAQVREGIIQSLEIAPGQFRGLVIANPQKNFCVGADLKVQADNIESGQLEKTAAGIDHFHRMSMLLKYSGIPVVAAVQRNVMGGGLEVCLHCDRVVAHSESYFGLVEPKVGLIPSGGGTTEMTVRAMEVARANPGLDVFPVLARYYDAVSAASVTRSAHEAKRLGYLRPTDRIVMNLGFLIDEAKEEALSLSRNYLPPVKRRFPVLGTDAHAVLVAKNNGKVSGGFITEYDAVILEKIACVMCGGDVPANTLVDEAYLLSLEKTKFLELSGDSRTYDRIQAMLRTGKPLKN